MVFHGAPDSENIRLSIVIPAFNEESRLARTLTETLSFLQLQPFLSEVIVVDDGSSDRTAAIANEFAILARGRLRLLRNPGNRGKGFAVRHGVMNARGQVVLFCDADLATPLSEVSKLLAPILEMRCDVAIGSREGSQRRTQTRLRQFLGAQFSQLRNRLLGVTYIDTQCGFKALRRNAAHSIFAHQTIEGFAFDVEILVIAQEQGWRALEVPVEWVHQPGSTVDPIRSSAAMLRDLLRIRRQMAIRRNPDTRARPVRTALRAAVRVVYADGTAKDGFLRNINRGGAFVAIPDMAKVGDAITIIVPLIDGEMLPLYGRVAHATSQHGDRGIGVEFSVLESNAISKLDALLVLIENGRNS